jgi:hypothetical protein
MAMTVNLRASSAPDLLASVPALAGFSARNSLVCVMLSGRTSCGAVRVDLPSRPRMSSYRAVVDRLVALLSTGPVDRTVPVIYTDQTFEGERGIPWLDFGRLLRKRLGDAGFPCLDVFCVAADGYASYLDREYPRRGRPLHEIEQSDLARRLDDSHSRPVDLEHWGRLPPADPSVATRVQEMISALEGLSRDPGGLSEREALTARAVADVVLDLGEPDPVSWVELCMTADEPTVLEAELWLLLLAQSPARRDAMMVQFAFGREIGQVMADVNESYAERARADGVSMDELVAAEIAEGGSGFADEVADILLGECRERPMRPASTGPSTCWPTSRPTRRMRTGPPR